MLSCKESARLISEGIDRELRLWQRLGLRVHLMMCSACRTYKRQIEALDKLIAEHFKSGPPMDVADPQRLPDDVRQTMKAALRDSAH